MLNTRAIRVATLGLLVWAASGAQKAAAPPRDPDVPYVPTTPEAVEAMLKLGQVKKTDLLYDLGCGDGRIVIAAAKNFGARGVGIDIDPQRIKEARENAKRAGVEDLVRFELGDLAPGGWRELGPAERELVFDQVP